METKADGFTEKDFNRRVWTSPESGRILTLDCRRKEVCFTNRIGREEKHGLNDREIVGELVRLHRREMMLEEAVKDALSGVNGWEGRLKGVLSGSFSYFAE